MRLITYTEVTCPGCDKLVAIKTFAGDPVLEPDGTMSVEVTTDVDQHRCPQESA